MKNTEKLPHIFYAFFRAIAKHVSVAEQKGNGSGGKEEKEKPNSLKYKKRRFL